VSARNHATIGGAGFSNARPVASLPSEELLKLVYFFGIPFILGSLVGWGRVGAIALALPRELAMLYWGGISLLLWNAKFLLVWLGVRVGLVSIRPALLSLALIACLAEILLRPLHRGIVLGLAPALEVTALPFTSLLPSTPNEVGAALLGHGPLIAVWVLTTVFYLRGLGVELFSPRATDVPPPATPAKQASGLLEKLPVGHGQIRALRALDHYVQVYLEDSRPMFIHRFDDAAREASSLGLLRIHRSFCVDPAAIAALESRGRRRFVVLESGEKLPVSATYLETLLSVRGDLKR